MSFKRTSAYPGNLRNSPKAVSECGGTCEIIPADFDGELLAMVSSIISSYMSSQSEIKETLRR